jgi:hypothetical protein
MRTSEEIDFLESYIPELANSAVKKAYLDTLANGDSVLEVIDNKLYKVFPDGKKSFIKEVSENIKIDFSKRIFKL